VSGMLIVSLPHPMRSPVSTTPKIPMLRTLRLRILCPLSNCGDTVVPIAFFSFRLSYERSATAISRGCISLHPSRLEEHFNLSPTEVTL